MVKTSVATSELKLGHVLHGRVFSAEILGPIPSMTNIRRPIVIQEKRGAEELAVYFYNDQAVVPRDWCWDDCKAGNRIHIRDPKLHAFMDGQIGFRIESLALATIEKVSDGNAEPFKLGQRIAPEQFEAFRAWYRANTAHMGVTSDAALEEIERNWHDPEQWMKQIEKKNAEADARRKAKGAGAHDHMPPLYKAAANGDLKEIDSCISHGERVDGLGVPLCADGRNHGITPLHIAACYGQPHAVGRLVEHRANIDVKDDSMGATPLHFAATSVFPDTVQELLNLRADPSAITQVGMTALQQLLRMGKTRDEAHPSEVKKTVRILAEALGQGAKVVRGRCSDCQRLQPQSAFSVAVWNQLENDRDPLSLCLSCSAASTDISEPESDESLLTSGSSHLSQRIVDGTIGSCRECGLVKTKAGFSKKVWKKLKADASYKPVCLDCSRSDRALPTPLDVVAPFKEAAVSLDWEQELAEAEDPTTVANRLVDFGCDGPGMLCYAGLDDFIAAGMKPLKAKKFVTLLAVDGKLAKRWTPDDSKSEGGCTNLSAKVKPRMHDVKEQLKAQEELSKLCGESFGTLIEAIERAESNGHITAKRAAELRGVNAAANASKHKSFGTK